MRKSNFIYHLINAAIFVILEIAALNMLKHNGPLQGAWMSQGAHNLMSFFWGGSQTISDYFSLKKTNDALARENFELRLRMEQLNSRFPEAAMYEPSIFDNTAGGYRYIPAEIVKISNNTQHNYMIIGKGYEDGVIEGSGVITAEGAVGVIDAVGRRHSYARSFKNHGMSISARLGKTGAAGPLTWDGVHSNKALLKEIPHHMTFSPGDTVFTSGYSSIFPSDIPLGITGEARIVNGATYEIDVTLFEDYSALRYITIVENLNEQEIKSLEEMR